MEIVRESIEKVTHDGKVLAEKVVNGKAGATLRLHGPTTSVVIDASEWDAWLASVHAADRLMAQDVEKRLPMLTTRPRKGNNMQRPVQAMPRKRMLKRGLSQRGKELLAYMASVDAWVRPDDVKHIGAEGHKSPIQMASNLLYTLASHGFVDMRGHRWRWEYKVTAKGKAMAARIAKDGQDG